jgi:hypothetical protein
MWGPSLRRRRKIRMRSRWVLVALAVAVAAIAVFFWPTGDPFAGVETVAIQEPDWGSSPQGQVLRGPFLEGLRLTLDGKHIRIVGDASQADAVLAIKDFKLKRIELAIEGGKIQGQASATCILTNLTTHEEYLMDFYLTLQNGKIEARLETRKAWQFWK